MQAFYKFNKTNNTSGIGEERRNYSGITSRKILNTGKQMRTKSSEGVDGWRLRGSHHALSGYATSAVDLMSGCCCTHHRKWQEMAGNHCQCHSHLAAWKLVTLRGPLWSPASLQTLVSATATGGRRACSSCRPNPVSVSLAERTLDQNCV